MAVHEHYKITTNAANDEEVELNHCKYHGCQYIHFLSIFRDWTLVKNQYHNLQR